MPSTRPPGHFWSGCYADFRPFGAGSNVNRLDQSPGDQLFGASLKIGPVYTKLPDKLLADPRPVAGVKVW
jgi:hypothetical protein